MRERRKHRRFRQWNKAIIRNLCHDTETKEKEPRPPVQAEETAL